MDCVYLKDLSLRCIIGVRPEERIHRQEVVINIRLDCDLSKAGESDLLEDAVNFRRTEKAVIALVEASEFNLIETLAHRIADACLDDPKVLGVHVGVDKPRALRFARSAGVEIHRARAGA